MTLLTTLADVKTYSGASDTSTDAVISQLIENASAFIERFCNRIFAITAYSETRNGNNRPRMTLNNGPISTVTSVTIDSVAIVASSGPTVPGYTFDEHSVYLRPGGTYNTFRRDVQNVQVSYSAGFATVPYDVAQACIELIQFKLAKRTRIDKKSETLGSQQTISFDLSDIPASVRSALLSYQRFTVFS